MEFKSKMLIVAMAAAMPWVGANAQSQSDLQKEIAALRAQLQVLQQKVEAMNATPAAPAANVAQQVNRLEQRLDLADDDAEKTGFRGLKINGTIEAGFAYDSQKGSNNFSASSGSTTDAPEYGGYGMLQISKESQNGEGVDWMLRLLPGAGPRPVNDTKNNVYQGGIIHEASLSIPVSKETRIIAGMIPDFQGYEMPFANANATLGNQLISHNALYDLAGATQYTGAGTSHTINGGQYAVKWLLGNVDPQNDTNPALPAYLNGTNKSTVALAYRGDWFINEFSYIGLSGLHGSANRNFRIMAIDGGYTHGDWQFNGQLSTGWMRNAAVNGDDAEWHGLSGLVGYKVTPRLLLLARADYIYNRKNGGGTYVVPGGGSGGLGQEKDSAGTGVTESDGVTPIGANLTRLTVGTNYQINQNTQWKAEYLLDTSTGYNFTQSDGVTPTRQRSRIGTSLVLSF